MWYAGGFFRYLNDFQTQLPNTQYVIFVCSTTGQGEVPDNMKFFWQFLLRKNLPPNSLQDTNFAVFGLGDSSYVKYNYVSKMLFNRLKQLGGTPLLRRGDGNDQHAQGLYGELFPWSEDLWRKLLTMQPLLSGQTIIDNTQLPPPKYTLVVDITTSPSTPVPFHKLYTSTPSSPYISAKMTTNQLLCAPDWEQDVRHITLKVNPKHKLNYNPGDVVYIQPQNPIKYVHKILNYLDLNPNLIITKISSNTEVSPGIHVPLTLEQLFICYLDFMGIPRRYFFELLSFFCTDERERDQLKYFSSATGYQELYEYNHKSKRSYLDVLMDFPSARPPLQYLFDLIGFIKPRPFSISSSNKACPDSIDITMVVVKYKSIINRMKHGICSTWLAGLTPDMNVKIPLYVRKGTLVFPTDLSTPVIMVGPGTGCAIFRSFLQERNWLIQNLVVPLCVGPTAFFFGCRSSIQDYLYQPEWQQLIQLKALTHFQVAFSRDQEQKFYVYHSMELNKELLWDLISKQNARFYISGKADKMPQDVRKTLIKIFIELGNMTEEEAQTYLRTMETQNRYMTETWA